MPIFEIMRAFVAYRAKMIENSELRKEIIRLDKKINSSFRFLLKKIDALTSGIAHKPRKQVGFKRKNQYFMSSLPIKSILNLLIWDIAIDTHIIKIRINRNMQGFTKFVIFSE